MQLYCIQALSDPISPVIVFIYIRIRLHISTGLYDYSLGVD
jgi:hypothetical protein